MQGVSPCRHEFALGVRATLPSAISSGTRPPTTRWKRRLPDAKGQDQDVLDTLTEREREVLEQRFGFKGRYSRMLEQESRQFQVTRERIRKLEDINFRFSN